jgi:flavin reductase (DIM6/NTAB) family NADH-FMN oxidoreductase RutF
MLSLNPQEITVQYLQAILQGAVGPRPIAFASTVDELGNRNLSPFSFFNVFSSNPPILIFSPARRVRDNTEKHTLQNVRQVNEVVINVVNYAMVQQVSLSSTEYPKGVDEFEKSGFTPISSVVVKPPRVKESPVQFECTVQEIISLGNKGGAGNLIICEVRMIHVQEDMLDESNTIDQRKIDLVARMGANWYCRANGSALFEVEKPLTTLGVGVDLIPLSVRDSPILTGNNLGQLGNVEHFPTKAEISEFKQTGKLEQMLEGISSHEFRTHQLAKELLAKGDVSLAWLVLLAGLELGN